MTNETRKIHTKKNNSQRKEPKEKIEVNEKEEKRGKRP